MKLYWVSAIIQNEADKKPKLIAMNTAELSLEEAIRVVSDVKSHNTVLSVWVDVFDENSTKQTVFHECYINAFGDIMA